MQLLSWLPKYLLLISCMLPIHSNRASAETILGCQYVEINGFAYKDGGWNPAGYNVLSPFFLKIDDNNLLIPESVEEGLVVGLGGNATCQYMCKNTSTTCAGRNGAVISYNTITRQGAVAMTYGATSDGDERDSVAVALFVCQKM